MIHLEAQEMIYRILTLRASWCWMLNLEVDKRQAPQLPDAASRSMLIGRG